MQYVLILSLIVVVNNYEVVVCEVSAVQQYIEDSLSDDERIVDDFTVRIGVDTHILPSNRADHVTDRLEIADRECDIREEEKLKSVNPAGSEEIHGC